MGTARCIMFGLALTGCAVSRVGDEAPTNGSATGPTFTDSGATPTTTEEPVYYVLNATLAVAAGELDPALTSVEVDLWDAAGQPLCSQVLPLLEATSSGFPPTEAELLGYWKLDLDNGAPVDDCPALAARTVWLGAAPYDAALDPAVVAGSLTQATAYSAVLREFAGGPVWLAGLVGTDDQLSGYADPVAVGPLPDGTYEFVGLVLLSL